jgi:hypothetical protein
MANASPRSDNEPLKNAPTNSAKTKIRKLYAATSSSALFDGFGHTLTAIALKFSMIALMLTTTC